MVVVVVLWVGLVFGIGFDEKVVEVGDGLVDFVGFDLLLGVYCWV